jgi:putative ABC transport system permease protein
MISIAREILLHDKLRFVITVVSLGFAILMIVSDVGMFYGVTEDSVTLIDRAQAQLWVSKKEETRLNAPSLVPSSVLYRARRLEGVRQACALDYSVGNLKIGDTRQVSIVGIDPACPLFQPWEITQGDDDALRRRDTVIVDDLALRGLNQAQVGETVELNGRELHLVAVTHDNKSFSYPFVYVNLQTFESLGGQPGFYSFIAVQLAPGADQVQIVQRLAYANSGFAITPEQAFKQSTIAALIAQGVGMIFVVVGVGVVVGMLIITLTMYTATMALLRDFAILKALGATRWKIWGVVLEQALTEMVVSFGLGLAASVGLNAFVETASGIRGRFPGPAIIAAFGLMAVLAIVGSLISIRKATSVDPVMVFRA